jgi:hypothetical protein
VTHVYRATQDTAGAIAVVALAVAFAAASKAGGWEEWE